MNRKWVYAALILYGLGILCWVIGVTHPASLTITAVMLIAAILFWIAGFYFTRWAAQAGALSWSGERIGPTRAILLALAGMVLVVFALVSGLLLHRPAGFVVYQAISTAILIAIIILLARRRGT